MNDTNDITALRKILFNTLEGLQDKNNPMDTDRAKTISDLAQTIINSAKAEIEYLKATGAKTSTDFIPAAIAPVPMPSNRINTEADRAKLLNRPPVNPFKQATGK